MNQLSSGPAFGHLCVYSGWRRHLEGHGEEICEGYDVGNNLLSFLTHQIARNADLEIVMFEDDRRKLIFTLTRSY